MDFFSAHHAARPPPAQCSPALDPFAQEIGRRFSAPPLLTSRLSPLAVSMTSTTTMTTPPLPLPPPPPASLAAPHARLVSLSLRSQPASPQASPAPVPAPALPRLAVVHPHSLLPVLQTPDVLVLDIRPHATFAQSRLPHALSLSVPSTLLKRPAFSLTRLAEMLPSPAARRLFSAWRSASKILVYDADSHAVPHGSTLLGLLLKFEHEGFKGDLVWLKGGFAAVWRDQRTLVDDGPPSPDSSEEEDSAGYLRARRLPSSAFQQVSTTTATQRPPLPASLHQHRPVAPAPTSTRPVPANPFYDNIRQNRELEHGITERIPLRLPPSVLARRDDLPFDWLRDIVDKAHVEEGTEAFAMQFYLIELREQRRLMGVMDHHSREASAVLGQRGAAAHFPYSITAGVEKGSKNRYSNIWPFEHARVRLNSCTVDDGSDYINASHVQPLGTRRRYIATQGPLPATFTDFWTLCWEQNIRIIVMLTKQVEGFAEKCGCYWKQTSYGPFRLELVSSSGVEEAEVRSAAGHPGFDFGLPSGASDADNATLRRTFLLSHTGYPKVPPRKITQLQHLAWPDFDVPEDPRGLLTLMRQVDVLRSEAEAEDSEAPPPPVLLHCSAGIGRTGGFIVADAALDGIRHEMNKTRAGRGKAAEGDAKGTSSRTSSMSDSRRDMTLGASPSPMSLDGPDTETHKARDFPSVRRLSTATSRPSRAMCMRQGRRDGSGTDTSAVQSDDSRTRSLSPGPSAPGTASCSSSGSGLRPSVAQDAEIRMPSPKPLGCMPPRKSFVSPGSAAGALSKFRLALASRSGEMSATTSTTHFPSVFSASLPLTDKSTAATSSFPVSVESSRSPSPAKDAEAWQNKASFDYTDPRRLHGNASPELLSSYDEPVRCLLEDMREQRMSLCQSLRQYVFVHRAIVEGALDIVDEARASAQQDESPIKGKRGPSPTELLVEDWQGAVRLTKRPSFNRRERNGTYSDAGSVATR